jgi:O-antigen ligase
MKKNQAAHTLNSNALWWIYGGTALITLYFNSKIQDPFNSPKMWILMVIAAWLVGHSFFQYQKITVNRNMKSFIVIILLFLSFLAISTAKTDLKYTAIFGESLRRNGFLTYISLSIFMMSAFLFADFRNIRRFIYIILGTSSFLAVYGYLQTTGRDFVSWNNPYNSIISTVGNPNFAAAVMAVLGVICFGVSISKSFKNVVRIFSGTVSLVLLFLIYQSDARQGLLSLILGIGIILLVRIYSYNKKLGHIATALSSLIFVSALLGMLQIGPLSTLLYKGSVSVRGFYWRAGIEMLKSNPLFGVGIDRYGAYFKEYREVQYPLNYGFNITSTNAHNVPIQLFATAGIFVGTLYLIIQLFILLISLKTIKKLSGNDQLIYTTLFAAWMAFQAQSIVSIDNIGISIWGWVIGGIIVGLGLKNGSSSENVSHKLKRVSNQSINLVKPLISSIATLLVLLMVVPLYRSESNMFQARTRFNPSAPENAGPLREYALKTINTPLVEPFYKLTSATYLVASGFNDEGIKILLDLERQDPRNLDLLTTLAEFNEQMNKLKEAESYRIKISKLDPWNASNYLRLGLIYKVEGRFSEMAVINEKIQSFASKTVEGEQAQKDLVA